MKKFDLPKKLLDKKIPTILGLFVLVMALVAGIFFLGEGPGVFAPRATPATTPQKIKVTNITDNSFTVSFLTDETTPGFIKYGTQASSLNSQSSDDRDQLSGTVSDYKMHHITVRGLKATTSYFYTLGTGSSGKFDNNGSPFIVKTTARNGTPSAAKTIYGSVSNQAGNPADGAVVYVSLKNAGEMSSLVKASGSWIVPLSNARTRDGSGYAQVVDTDNLIISVQGNLPTQSISHNILVQDAQPIPTLVFGQTLPVNQVADAIQGGSQVAGTPTEVDIKDTAELFPDTAADDVMEKEELSSRSAVLDELVEPLTSTQSASPEAKVELLVLNVDIAEPQVITTSQPKITGKVAPNVQVTIEVHSENNIQEFIIADENGNFELDIASLSETLEPGPHEVIYSYTDPTTNEVISKTVNFTVEAPVQQIAQADTQDEPYGSGNPYPPETATQEAVATVSAQSTQEARVSMPATDEPIPVSGSVGTTMALVFGGLFFITAGLWSLWISNQLGKEEIEF
jgi:hypothetical protein